MKGEKDRMKYKYNVRNQQYAMTLTQKGGGKGKGGER